MGWCARGAPAEGSRPGAAWDRSDRTDSDFGRRRSLAEEVLNSQSEIVSRELVVCDRKTEVENPKVAKRVPAGSATATMSKREKKRWRREMTRRELERGRTGKQKGDQRIEDMLGGIECLLPNTFKLLREEIARAP
jgi:hypothetical protein